MSCILVFGLSGQIGEELLPLLRSRDYRVVAVSRSAREAVAGVEWRLGSFQALPEIPPEVDAIISLGPLDSFAAWFAGATTKSARVIAIGSTGRIDKIDSTDPDERDVAQRLGLAEARLFEIGKLRSVSVTVLRPTLLYGNGRDRTISRMLQFARRWRALPLPSTATGLRQPVHVGDVADAILSNLDSAQTAGHGYDLPGGETLAFDAMLRRTLARHAPGCRVLPVPALFLRAAIKMAAWLKLARIDPGVLARLQRDQLADPTAARLAFGYQPRSFDP